MTDRHPENELRCRLWKLADDWNAEPCTNRSPAGIACSWCLSRWEAAAQLRKALTYPAAGPDAERELRQQYGKSSEELADEAEAGYDVSGDRYAIPPNRIRDAEQETEKLYREQEQHTGVYIPPPDKPNWPVEPPLSPADRSFDERGMSL